MTIPVFTLNKSHEKKVRVISIDTNADGSEVRNEGTLLDPGKYVDITLWKGHSVLLVEED